MKVKRVSNIGVTQKNLTTWTQKGAGVLLATDKEKLLK